MTHPAKPTLKYLHVKKTLTICLCSVILQLTSTKTTPLDPCDLTTPPVPLKMPPTLTPPPPNYRKDLKSILLLLLLYILQGIPLGLIASVPLLLQAKSSVSYKEQAKFSFAYWPFSLKLLWAPIVDSIYSKRFGRRKTWLVPMQFAIGAFMYMLSYRVDGLIENGSVTLVTGVFFLLNFLAATQDIAVDGWALTMLRRENVGYASTCNSVGQTAGYFLGYVVFLALESPDFCNKYLRSNELPIGMVTLSGFLYFWSIVFVVTTTLVMVFKKEEKEEVEKINIVESYKGLLEILGLKSVRKLVFFLLTCKIGFAAADSVTGLKLVEAGVPKDRLALLAIPMTPLQIVLPLFISRYTAGANSMDVFIKAFPFRLGFGLVFAAVVYYTPRDLHDYPFRYYLLLLGVYAVHQVTLYSQYVALMSFFAKVSDPTVGGTYMTLLNTLCNLGGNWPSTLALWLVDPLSKKECSTDPSNDCSSSELKSSCHGKCLSLVDGYYVESIVCVVIGLLWLYTFGRKCVRDFKDGGEGQWRVKVAKRP